MGTFFKVFRSEGKVYLLVYDVGYAGVEYRCEAVKYVPFHTEGDGGIPLNCNQQTGKGSSCFRRHLCPEEIDRRILLNSFGGPL